MKMTKKLMMFALACAAAMPLIADTETVGGYTWTYRLNGDTAEIYGTYNSSSYRYTLCISPEPTGAVTIPSTLGGKPVTSIGDYAFRRCSGLTSVTIPDGVTSIRDYAFYGCRNLTNVTTPNCVTNIGECAFSECIGLKSVVIPDRVTSIGDSAFSKCIGLTSVTIPESVTSFSTTVFDGCNTLWTSWYRALVNGSTAGCGSASVVTTIVQQVEAPYALTNSVVDRAIASVTVNGDCAIDSFVLKDGKVYDSVLYISNTADQAVALTLPSGYVYKAIKGARPLNIPANSQSILSITRLADNVFLVSREDLETIQ